MSNVARIHVRTNAEAGAPLEIRLEYAERRVERLQRLLLQRKRTNWWLQGPILVLGALSVFLIGFPETAFWGYVVGMATQPFFLRSAAVDRQWGVFALGFVYCAVFAAGIARTI